MIRKSVKDDNSEKQLNDQKAEVGNDGDTPNKAPSLPPGVTIKKGKCSIEDKLVDAAKCFAAKVTAPVCASCSQSCSCTSVLNDAGSDGNDLFDELEHMGKKVGKQLAEKIEAAAQKSKIMAEQQVQLVKDQVKMEEAKIGSNIEGLEKKIAKHESLG